MKSDDNVKATETDIQRNDIIADTESGTVQSNDNGEQQVPPKAITPMRNYDLSVKSPIIHENNSYDSEDNEDPLSLSEIPTS